MNLEWGGGHEGLSSGGARFASSLRCSFVVTLLLAFPGLTPEATAPPSIILPNSATKAPEDPTPRSSSFIAVRHPFGVGERFVYDIRWGVITAGSASLEVRAQVERNSRPAYHLVATARSNRLIDAFYKVRDSNEAWLDMQTLVSHGYEQHLREGPRYWVDESVVFNHEQRRCYIVEVKKDQREERQAAIPPNVLDIFSSFYYVRTQPLEVGRRLVLDVSTSGKTWPLVVEVKRRETVRVPAGRFECFLLEPSLRERGLFIKKGKRLEVWITVDERRMPVLMRSEVFIGHVSAELVGAKMVPLALEQGELDVAELSGGARSVEK